MSNEQKQGELKGSLDNLLELVNDYQGKAEHIMQEANYTFPHEFEEQEKLVKAKVQNALLDIALLNQRLAELEKLNQELVAALRQILDDGKHIADYDESDKPIFDYNENSGSYSYFAALQAIDALARHANLKKEG